MRGATDGPAPALIKEIVMSKKASIKKTIVKLDTSKMTPAERVTFARTVQNTAKTSPVFQGSANAQTSMATWQTATDALDQNQQGIAKAEKGLVTLRGQEAQLVFDYDAAASDYAAVVRTLAKDDPTIVPTLGLTEKATKTATPDIVAPLGLKITTTKAGVDSLAWNIVPGAHLYLAQISVDPATDPTWITLTGGGRRRKLLGLVHGQKYLLRVKALGAKQEGPWSATLGYVGK
jgi:hypothetical protein